MEWAKDDYLITTDKQQIDVAYVHRFLQQSYWAKGIPLAVVQQSINGSLCFTMKHHDRQVGFARVITDAATFAYLADVFIDEHHRRRGLSKWLLQIILQYPSLQGLRRMLLATRDAQGLYEQAGFTTITHPERWMQLHHPDIYQNKNV